MSHNNLTDPLNNVEEAEDIDEDQSPQMIDDCQDE